MARKNGPGRPFQKGQSGNPGGKSKATAAVEALAREGTQEAIALLREAVTSGDAPWPARITAAVALLDRGHGRPGQRMTVEANVRRDPESFTDAELAAIAAGGGGAAAEAEDDPGASGSLVH